MVLTVHATVSTAVPTRKVFRPIKNARELSVQRSRPDLAVDGVFHGYCKDFPDFGLPCAKYMDVLSLIEDSAMQSWKINGKYSPNHVSRRYLVRYRHVEPNGSAESSEWPSLPPPPFFPVCWLQPLAPMMCVMRYMLCVNADCPCAMPHPGTIVGHYGNN